MSEFRVISPEDDREVFADGNMTDVVRRGGTVLRQRGPWWEASRAVLDHLESVGFPGAPRYVGVEDAKTVLTFMPGISAPANLDGFASDDVLLAVARLIRDLHAALASFHPDPKLEFPRMPGTPGGSTLVCHNDLAPWNTIFDDTTPVGFIDWDLVAPAPPAWDLAYATWRFVPLYPDDERFGDPDARGRRLRLFLDAYGLGRRERVNFVALIRQRQVCGYETVEQWGRAGLPGFVQLFERRLHAGALDDIAWLDRHAPVLNDAILA